MGDQLTNISGELVVVVLQFEEGLTEGGQGLDLLREGFDDLWGVDWHLEMEN